jgi:adenosylcobinamide-GDP ribazoletransferase
VQALRSLAAAVAFLTCVPMPRGARPGTDTTAGAVPLFPLVGAAVGAAAGAVATGAAILLPPLAAGAAGVAFAAAVTGGLHLDALADTADALGSRSREEALRIMRDHAIGTFGAVALVLVLIVHASVLGELAHDGHAVATAAAAGATSRAVAVPLAASLPDLRAGRGSVSALGSLSAGRVSATLGLAGVVALAVLGPEGGIALLAPAAVGSAAWIVYRRWLGGVTGDALGAAVQLAETATLTALAAST